MYEHCPANTNATGDADQSYPDYILGMRKVDAWGGEAELSAATKRYE
jgi:hypothetical protein